jgi:hypothetical protein
MRRREKYVVRNESIWIEPFDFLYQVLRILGPLFSCPAEIINENIPFDAGVSKARLWLCRLTGEYLMRMDEQIFGQTVFLAEILEEMTTALGGISYPQKSRG